MICRHKPIKEKTTIIISGLSFEMNVVRCFIIGPSPLKNEFPDLIFQFTNLLSWKWFSSKINSNIYVWNGDQSHHKFLTTDGDFKIICIFPCCHQAFQLNGDRMYAPLVGLQSVSTPRHFHIQDYDLIEPINPSSKGHICILWWQNATLSRSRQCLRNKKKLCCLSKIL